MTRPQQLASAFLALALVPLAWLGLSAGRTAPAGGHMSSDDNAPFPVSKTDEEWRQELTPLQYSVLRRHDTEFAGTSPLNTEHRDGMFVCAGCGQPLFSSDTKYESGSGWPSFYDALDGAVATSEDRSLGMRRIEFHCSRCGGHLGHVFPDGPGPTGMRYCTNGAALDFKPAAPSNPQE